MIEYILALLLTSGIMYLFYNLGKRAGIKEEQLRVEKEKNSEWERFVQVVSSNTNMSNDSVNAWLQERAEKSNTNMQTEL